MFKVPIQKLNIVLDEFGIENGWKSILATHIRQMNNPELDYVLKQKEFLDYKILDIDLIGFLSIGEISALYEYSLAYVDSKKRKEDGQYFTPDDVAQLMAKKSLNFSVNKIWLDPCSGVGNLSFWLIKLQKDPEKFLNSKIYLIDKDKTALFIARTLFTINFQNKNKNLFFDLAPKFLIMDFLYSEKLPKFDFAILNPPYVGVSADYKFETAEACDLYAYFIERAIKLSKGFISVSPQNFTNGQKFQSFRKLLIDKMKDISIYCFDNVPDNIFKGIKFGSINTNKANSTRAGIIVAKKNGRQIFRITPLLRWRAAERKKMLDIVDDYLTETKPTSIIFPKIQKEFLALYQEALNSKFFLIHLVSQNPTPYKLVVPSTPRYFISALKTDVNRSSFKTLYFYNKKDLNLAYLLLNSSYIYWWWRVNDGGMTISEKTLLSLPIPENIEINKNIIFKIEKSESINRVVKKNAGKDNENVKHSQGLVEEINKIIFPKFVSAFSLLHNNSVI